MRSQDMRPTIPDRRSGVFRLMVALAFVALDPLGAQIKPAAPAGGKNPVTAAEEPLQLERVEVKAKLDDVGFDATGMGASR